MLELGQVPGKFIKKNMTNNSLNSMFSIINIASVNHLGSVYIPVSKKCLKVLSVLLKEGLIKGFSQNKYKITKFFSSIHQNCYL